MRERDVVRWPMGAIAFKINILQLCSVRGPQKTGRSCVVDRTCKEDADSIVMFSSRRP